MYIVKWVASSEGEELPEPSTREDWDKKERVLIEHIREKGYKFTGQAHQEDDHPCTPVFSDGTAICCSQRAWGAIMAEAWEGDPNDYVLWAWNFCHRGKEEDFKFPK